MTIKRYIYGTVYRQQQITKICYATSIKAAALLFDVAPSHLRRYCVGIKSGEPFEGVRGYFDSGMLWRERPELIRVEMPLADLTAMIDEQMNAKYNDL